jgi:hypothetical protein
MKMLGPGAQGQTPSPFGGVGPSPFADAFSGGAQDYQPEAPPPRAPQAKLQSAFDETPGLQASALLGGDPEGAMLEDEPPPPVRIDLAKIAEQQNKPTRIDLSSMPRPKSNEELLAEQGYSPTSIQANVFDPQGGVTDIPRAAQSGGVTDIPRSAFEEPAYDEDVPAPVPAPAAPSAFEPTFDTGQGGSEAGPFDSFGGGLDYVQDWLGESETNPLFQTGMALLASGYDGSNPFTGMQANLGGVQTGLRANATSETESRKAESGIADAGKQAQLQEALAMIAAMYGDQPASQSSKGQASLIR